MSVGKNSQEYLPYFLGRTLYQYVSNVIKFYNKIFCFYSNNVHLFLLMLLLYQFPEALRTLISAPSDGMCFVFVLFCFPQKLINLPSVKPVTVIKTGEGAHLRIILREKSKLFYLKQFLKILILQ